MHSGTVLDCETEGMQRPKRSASTLIELSKICNFIGFKTAEEPRKGRGALPPARSVSPPANHKQQHGTGPEPNTKQTTQPA